MNSLKQAFAFDFNKLVWKILIDGENHLMAIETRDKPNKVVSFSVINVKTNTLLINNYQFTEKWLCHLHSIHQNFLVINYSSNENSPVKTGFSVLNIENLTVYDFLNYNIKEIFKEGLLIFTARISPSRLQLLKWEELQEKDLLNMINTDGLKSFKDIEIFTPYTDLSLEWFNLSSVLNYKDYQIKTLYEDKMGIKNQVLKVVKNSNILLEVILDKKIQKANPEPFFVWFSRLFYIQNKSEIVSYFL